MKKKHRKGFYDMRILLSGASGFIGQYLGPELEKKGHQVTKMAHKSYINEEYISCDITQYEQVKILLKEQDFVIHLACVSLPACIKDPNLGFKVNVLGTNNIARCCAEADIALLMISTSEVYGFQSVFPISEDSPKKPISIYGGYKLLSEQCCENWAESSGLNHATVRLFNIFGPSANGSPRNTVETIFLRKALANESITVSGGELNSRDFLYINDAVRGLILAAENFEKIQNQVINLGSGIETSLSSLAFLICKHIGAKSDLIKISDHGIPLRSQADIQLAQTLLNFKPEINLSNGIDIISDSLGGHKKLNE